MNFPRRLLWSTASLLLVANSAHAAFHLMQIEQIIGGVNGDVTAQAIQLRMRTGGQSSVSLSRLTAVDATGGTEVLVKDLTTSVSNGATVRTY